MDRCLFQKQDEVDAFKRPFSPAPGPKYLQNCDYSLLIAYSGINEEDSGAEFKSYYDVSASQAKFFLHPFRENGQHRDGIPVLISVDIDNKNYIMYSAADDSVHFKRNDVPIDIPSTKSEFIFYQKAFSAGHTSLCFESSMKQHFYLSFEKENNDQPLVLKYCPPGELNETIKIFCKRAT
ncbi:interleukin-18-like [Pelodytes ibericus]